MKEDIQSNIQFDPKRGAINSLERVTKTTTQHNYYIETAPVVGEKNHWITSVYQYGKYTTFEDFNGNPTIARRRHYFWLRKIKTNGYKIDVMLTNVKREIEKELPTRIMPSRFITVGV